MVDNVPADKAASLHLKDGGGAAITGVDQDGPACRAGLKRGDIVVAFNGKHGGRAGPVRKPDSFQRSRQFRDDDGHSRRAEQGSEGDTG